MNSTNTDAAVLLKNPRVQRWAAILAMAAAYLHNAYVSWGKWGDVLVDTGFDLQNARILMEPGSRLYVNPIYWYGPLAPELNALLFRIFGVNAWVICYAGLLCAALMTCVLYRTARLFTGRVIAAATAIAFLYCCAFAQLSYNAIFNFVLGYSASASYGALLAAGGTFFLIRHAKKFRALDFWLSILFLTLTAFTKIEIFAAAILAHVAFLVGICWSRKLDWKLHAPGYAAAIAAVLGVYSYFYSIAGPALFNDNLFPFLSNVHYQRYARQNMGTDDLGVSLIALLQSIGFHAAAIVPAVLVGFYADSRLTAKRALTVVLTLLGGLAFLVYYVQSLETAFRFLPALGAAVLIGLIIQAFKNTQRRAELLPAAILWTFALGMLFRMLLKTVSYHYGYYQLPPALLAMFVFYVAILPGLFTARPRMKFYCAAAILGLSAGIVVKHFAISVSWFKEKTMVMATERGQLELYPMEVVPINNRLYELPIGSYWTDVVAFLTKLPRDANVLIVPFGDMSLTFFSGLNDPYKNYPPFFTVENGRFDDDDFLAKVKALPPDYIVVIKRSKPEAELGYFGESYSVKIWAWLQPQYDVIKEYPEPRNGVALKYIQILKRK